MSMKKLFMSMRLQIRAATLSGDYSLVWRWTALTTFRSADATEPRWEVTDSSSCCKRGALILGERARMTLYDLEVFIEPYRLGQSPTHVECINGCHLKFATPASSNNNLHDNHDSQILLSSPLMDKDKFSDMTASVPDSMILHSPGSQDQLDQVSSSNSKRLSLGHGSCGETSALNAGLQ
ncbi:hypothetical protein U0070_000964, partial [Myodes glareolus]